MDIAEGWSPDESLMTLVAYTVNHRTLSSVISIARTEKIAFSIDDAILQSFRAFEREAKNEIMSRRHWWAMMAACIYKFDARWATELPEQGARIWLSLLNSVEVADGALQHNVVWSDEEKSALLASDAPCSLFVMYVPEPYRGTPLMREFASRHGIAPIFLR